MNARHSVLFYPDHFMPNTSIMWIEGNKFHKEELPDPCYTLYDLAEVAYSRFITHLWVMPTYGEFEPAGSNSEWGISPYYNRKKTMMGATVFKRGHQRKDLDIIFPRHTAWWPDGGWVAEVDPQELLIVIRYLEQLLGIPVGASPGRVGWSYLKKLHPEWIEELGVDLRSMHFDNSAAGDVIWEADNIAEAVQGLDGLFVHKFDKGAAYPYAASQTDMGAGVPVHVDGDDGSSEHYKGQPQGVGVWRCTIAYNVWDYDESLPPVWAENKGSRMATEGWLAGPVIRLLRDRGHTVTVHEGYVFPERHNLMTRWANSLWQIRVNYGSHHWKNQRCAKLAQHAIKRIANSTVGMTAFRGFDDSDDMKRPDIRVQAIARHRELTWHNISKIFDLYRIAPVIVYMDALYFVSGNPDGRAVVPELVKREGQFGGYRYEGRVAITPDVQAMFAEKMGVGRRLEFLNKKGWQE